MIQAAFAHDQYGGDGLVDLDRIDIILVPAGFLPQVTDGADRGLRVLADDDDVGYYGRLYKRAG